MYNEKYFKKVIGENLNIDDIYTKAKNNSIFKENVFSKELYDDAVHNTINTNFAKFNQDLRLINCNNTEIIDNKNDSNYNINYSKYNKYNKYNKNESNFGVNEFTNNIENKKIVANLNNTIQENKVSVNSDNIRNNVNKASVNSNSVINNKDRINANSNNTRNSENISNVIENRNMDIGSNNEIYFVKREFDKYYPEIYKVIYPMIESFIDKNSELEYSEELIETIAKEIYNAIEVDIDSNDNSIQVSSNVVKPIDLRKGVDNSIIEKSCNTRVKPFLNIV